MNDTTNIDEHFNLENFILNILIDKINNYLNLLDNITYDDLIYYKNDITKAFNDILDYVSKNKEILKLYLKVNKDPILYDWITLTLSFLEEPS